MKQKFICKPGSRSYNRRSLHHIGNSLNPYEQAISIVGKTLSAFDEDNLIPCFGFGDGRSNAPSMIQCINNLNYFADVFPFLAASTHDQNVFSFFPNDQPCNGFEEVLHRYKEIVPLLKLAGFYF